MTTAIHPPAIACHFMCFMDLVYWQWRAGISGLNTEPAPLLPPASDSRYRVCLRIQLLTPPASQARALRAGCWPPATLPARRAYRPEGSAYGSES